MHCEGLSALCMRRVMETLGPRISLVTGRSSQWFVPLPQTMTKAQAQATRRPWPS